MNHKQAAKFWIYLFATLPARILATGSKPTQVETPPEVRRQTEKAIEELAKTSLREYYEGNR